MNWKNIKIKQYQKLLPSKIKNKLDIEVKIHNIAVCYKMPFDKVRALPLKKAKKYLDAIKFIEKPIEVERAFPYFFCKGRLYKSEVDVKKLTFDQYMTAMQLIKDINDNDESIEQNLHYHLANISRPIIRKKYNLLTMANNFQERLSMANAYPLMKLFITNLEALNKEYSKLFEVKGATGNASKSFTSWGWIITLDNLSNSDPTKWNYYKELNVIEALNICMFYKAKNDEQERELRLQKLRQK
jgi:hypothetical protein